MRHLKSTPLLLVMVLFVAQFTGCESDHDATVTGALYNREPGKLAKASVDPDSLTISARYRETVGSHSSTFAGTYGSASAFTLLKFSTPGQSILDSLDTAIVSLTVRDSWADGDFQYALYNIHSEWDEADSLFDADSFLSALAEPIAIVADTAEALSSLTFTLPASAFQDWGDDGSFLLKEAPGASGMLYLASDNSTSNPTIDFIAQNADAGFDTTTVSAREGTYLITTGIGDDAPVLSDGEARGYVYTINLPPFASPPTPINGCKLTFNMGEHLFVETGMTVKLYMLTEAFTTIADAETDVSSAIDIALHPDSTSFTVDISTFIDAWQNNNVTNNGILVKPLDVGTSPDYAVLTPADSLIITYTTLSEVR